MYYYEQTEPNLWSVFFQNHDHQNNIGDRDFQSKEAAAIRVRYLNGGDITESEREKMNQDKL